MVRAVPDACTPVFVGPCGTGCSTGPASSTASSPRPDWSSVRSTTGPNAHSFHHRDRKEDQRGCYGAQAHRYERGARFGSDIRSGRWWRWIETERFRHVVPPENLKVDGVPAEYPDDAADPPQPSHRRISGSCHRCTDLVYHGCRLATCSPAMPDDRHSAG